MYGCEGGVGCMCVWGGVGVRGGVGEVWSVCV